MTLTLTVHKAHNAKIYIIYLENEKKHGLDGQEGKLQAIATHVKKKKKKTLNPS